MKHAFTPDDLDINLFAIKKYFKYDQLNVLLNEHIPSLPYTCRGIYIKPLFLKFRDVLINFNDDNIKKVERVKYNNIMNTGFLLKGGGSDSPKIDTAPKPKIDVDALLRKNNYSESCSNTQFNTRKTSSPDIYELFDNDNNMIGIAGVPTMRISKAMRILFESKNIVDKIMIDYEFNQKFNKYIPIIS